TSTATPPSPPSTPVRLFKKLNQQFHPILTTLTNSSRCCSGTKLKFASCTNGQTIQLLSSAWRYVVRSRSSGEAPSSSAMLDRNTPMKVGAKMVWSHATRARAVRVGEAKLTCVERRRNQVAAQGP